MSHLPKGMQLVLNGEKNGFYRVFLNSKTCGWIDKSSVEQVKQEQTACEKDAGRLMRAKCRLTKDFYVYEFEFNKKVPFTIREENSPSSGLTFEFFYVKGSNDNTLSLNIPTQKIAGYDGYWQDEKFVLMIRRTPILDCEKPLKSIAIAVDAGHGGNEVGAIGCCGDKEKNINLAISKYLEAELDKRGAKVLMTREEDVDVSLSDRVKFAREKESEILLSIHANALPDNADPIKNRGTSVYYYHNQAKSLAECILNSMTTQLGTQNDKVRQGSLALVRPTASVSVLIEVAYMINPDDSALLTDKVFQQKCAKAIADGIEEYLRK
jgi:N-acetylmuramoyl-L-alanine amidase